MVQKGSGSTSRSGTGDGPRGEGRQPPRRQSAEVYRRRRLVAGIAAGVLLVLVAVGLVQTVAAVLGADEPEAAPGTGPTTASAAPAAQEPFADFTPRPDRSASTSAPASAPADEPAEECGSELAVRASTDRETYPQGTDPALRLTLENTGEDPCRVDAGTSEMVYEVSSGSDTVFDSRHCQAEGDNREITLEPGQEISTAPLTWNRTRSVEGCTEAGEEAMPGYYRLVVSLGDRSSEPAPFVLE